MGKPLSPSAAARWIACPGSHYVAQQLPPLPSSPAADEGTPAHTFAAWAAADLAGDVLASSFVRAYEADAGTLRTPGEHCRWRPARSVCLAAIAEPLLLACTAAGMAEQNKDATDEQIGAWLTAIKRVDRVADGLARIAKAHISGGSEIPGWRISWRKKLDWDTEEKGPRAAASDIAGRLGIDPDDLIKISVKSPAELKKTLPADAIASVTREMVSSALIGSK